MAEAGLSWLVRAERQHFAVTGEIVHVDATSLSGSRLAPANALVANAASNTCMNRPD